MIKKLLAMAVALAAVALLNSAATGQGLCVGEPAPKLNVKKFVKGAPVTQFEKGKIYVIEFWATWCGPCRDSIPHLTEMAKKHPEVTFVGVSTWEAEPERVEPFVEKMGDKMNYRVAMDAVPAGADGFSGAMALTWMQAAEQRGIPTAFIINKEGKVAWIGHPMVMDKPLSRILAGTWDIKPEAQKSRTEMVAAHKLRVLNDQINPAYKAKEYTKAMSLLEDALTSDPSMETELAPMKIRLLHAQGKLEQEAEYINKVVDGALKDAISYLNEIAWVPVDPDAKQKSPPSLIAAALKAALRSDELAQGKIPYIADTLAAAYFADGKTAKAVETELRAIQLIKGTPLESDRSYAINLARYQAAK